MNYQEFSDFLDVVNLSRKEFASITNMNYSAVCGWSTRPIPGWVDSWLVNYKKAIKLDKITEMIKKELETEAKK